LDETGHNTTATPAQGDARFGLAFWSFILLLGSVGTAALIWPQAGGWVSSGWDSTAAPFVRLFEAYCPEALQPMALRAASVFLSPWLYLLMAVVFLAEKYIPADTRQRVFSVGMLQDFVGWFAIGGVIRVVLVGLIVSGLYSFCNRYLAGLRVETVAQWPTALVVVLAVLMGDLLNWFHHYLRHKIAVLWLFHTIHHSQKQMNMFTDLRVHLVEYAVTKPITVLPLFVLGLDMQLAFWLTLLLESYTRIYHGNLRTNYGPLRYLMVTPQSHRIHHSTESRHADKNFAVLFSFWDRLFGTQWPNYNEYPETGVDDAGFPHEQSVGRLRILSTYLRQLAYPFQVIWSGSHNGRDASARRADGEESV
jgi:sterol desaturase/sphingolipid hydroxylase (fatty acid hydroxylase superfamily)